MSRVLDTFLELVAIDSPSGEEAACGRYVADALTRAGMTVRFDDTAERTGSDTGNLIAEMTGTVPGRRIVMSAHLDTVEPGRNIVPVVEGGVIRSAGDTVLGADDKVGVAAVIEVVRKISEGGLEHPRITVVMTTGEEQGLRGAKALDLAALSGTDLALVFDAEGAPGGIVEGAPTHYAFVAEFEGTASHAGVAPERGVSALVMAAQAICRMKLGRLDEATTANIGSVTGGVATNVVAPSAVVTGECRSLHRERVEEVRLEIESALRTAAERAGGRVDVRWTKEYDGFLFETGDPMVELVEAACRDSRVEPRLFRTGGGSDGNIFTAGGIPTVVLSCGMTSVHSTSESVAIADIEKMVEIVQSVVRRAAAS